jgi:hypothetical protein
LGKNILSKNIRSYLSAPVKNEIFGTKTVIYIPSTNIFPDRELAVSAPRV